MTVKVEFTKVFNAGVLAGKTIVEVMPFVSEGKAKEWMDGVNSTKDTDYTVTDMKVVTEPYNVKLKGFNGF